MKNNGWVKHFLDGKAEYGYDHLIKANQASWSRGRLTGMCAVEIVHNDKIITGIHGPGEYHQSDDYEVSMISDRYRLLKRRIQKLISSTDLFIHADKDHVRFYGISIVNLEGPSIARVQKDMIGQWLTVEYDCIQKNIHISLKDKRI